MPRLNFYLVKETSLARLYRDRHDAEQWVPRSVCARTVKHPAQAGGLPLHEVEIEDWWVAKNPWPKGQAGLGI
jgi:hypothetical protein